MSLCQIGRVGKQFDKVGFDNAIVVFIGILILIISIVLIKHFYKMSKKKEKELKDKEVENTVEKTVENNDQASKQEEVVEEQEFEAKEEVVEEVSEEEKLKEQLEKEKDRYLRLFAEFENYKRRTSKERLDLFKTANSELMLALLPVLDDFDRGMVEIEKSEDKALVDGVQLIRAKLRDILSQKNLEEVPVEQGSDFDSDIHEAITQIPAPTEELKGKIVDVVEKGYQLGEKIIRYPKVVLGMK